MKRNFISMLTGAVTGICIGVTPVLAQQLDVEWVTPFSGSGRFIVTSETTLDPQGNVFAVGSFQDSMEVNTVNGPVKLIAGTTEDMFVSKMNPSGAIEWIKQVGGKAVLGNNSGSGSDQFVNHYFSIVSDNRGDLYITGNYRDTVDFDPGNGTVTRSTGSYLGGVFFPGQIPPVLFYENGFILKLSNDGEFRWVRTLHGKSNSISSIALDQNTGTFAVTGYFEDTVDFNNRLGTDVLVATPPGRNVFVARYDTAGQFKWVRKMGGGNSSGTRNEGNGISINNQGYIFTVGVFRDSADFDPGPGIDILRSAVAPAENVFVSKLDSNGNHVWARAMGGISGSSGARGSAIATDHLGNVLTTGYFQGTASFDPTNNTTIPSNANLSLFISKLDSAGNYVWAKGLNRIGAGVDHGTGIAVDQNDAVYVTGYFMGTIFLDPDFTNVNRDTFKTTSGSAPDPFLLKLDANGDYEWGRTITSKSGSRGYHVLVPRSQEVYLSGNFSDTTLFNPLGANQHSIIAPLASYGNGFTMKLFCVETSSAAVTMEVCGDSLEYNGVVYTSTGTYTQSLVNAVGCDSTLTINLTLYPVITPEIIVAEHRLSTMIPYKTYQWLLEGQKIDGATDSVYHVTANGNYRVAVTTDNDCPDTSRVYTVTNVGIDNITLAGQLTIYPNPVTDRIHIASPLKFDVQVVSVEGKLIQSEKATNVVHVQHLAPGLYFLKIAAPDGELIKTEKFIKE